MELSGKEALSYLVANLTRWTTHFIAFTRLLALKGSLRHAVFHHQLAIIAAQVGAEKNTRKVDKLCEADSSQCDMIDDRRFWEDLQTIVDDIEPICLATNINQKDDVRPDEVLLAFAGIFLHFSRHPNVTVKNGMRKRLEKRWKGLDQDLFVFALILNPFEKLSRFGDEAGASVFTLSDLFTQVCYILSPLVVTVLTLIDL